jgi:hypothetical protein
MERTQTQAAAVVAEGLVCCFSAQVLRLRAA